MITERHYQVFHGFQDLGTAQKLIPGIQVNQIPPLNGYRWMKYVYHFHTHFHP